MTNWKNLTPEELAEVLWEEDEAEDFFDPARRDALNFAKPRFVVLVASAPTFDDWTWFGQVLDRIDKRRAVTIVMHGGGRHGADKYGFWWAHQMRIESQEVPDPADYSRRPSLGIRQRDQIRAKPDFIVCFDDSFDTRQLTERAKAAGIPVMQAWRYREEFPDRYNAL